MDSMPPNTSLSRNSGRDFPPPHTEYAASRAGVAVLKSGGDVVKGISPHAVFVAVLPVVVAAGDWRERIVDEHRLYSGRAGLYAKVGLVALYFFLCRYADLFKTGQTLQ